MKPLILIVVIGIFSLARPIMAEEAESKTQRFAFQGWEQVLNMRQETLLALKSEKREVQYRATMQAHLQVMFRCWLASRESSQMIEASKIRKGLKALVEDQYSHFEGDFDPKWSGDPFGILRDTEGLSHEEGALFFKDRMRIIACSEELDASLGSIEKYLELVQQFHSEYRESIKARRRDQGDRKSK